MFAFSGSQRRRVFPCIPDCCVRSGNGVTSRTACCYGFQDPFPSSFNYSICEVAKKCALHHPHAGPLRYCRYQSTMLNTVPMDTSPVVADRRSASQSVPLSPFFLGSQPSLTFSTDLCDNYGCPSDHFQLYAACRTVTAPSPHASTTW